MGAAIRVGLDLVRQRKDEYRANGIAFYRPWVFMITDGAPTDDWQAVAALIQEGERSKAFAFFAVDVAGANMDVLRQLSVREPLKLEGLKFRELFQWLSNSMKSVSQSLQIAFTNSKINEVALFSDGLQRLALSFEQRTPHTPFFEPMLKVLRSKEPLDCAALDGQLAGFLDSPQVNERTDDDKTLVLASRVDRHD
jgi:hypothetical protein